MSKSSEHTGLMKEITDNAGVVATSTWLERAIVFGTAILVVRIQGPELYGSYILGRKIFTLVFILAVFGLDTSLVKFISAYRKTEEEKKLQLTAATSFTLGISFAFVMCGLFMLFSSFLENIFSMPFLSRVLVFFALSLPFSVFLRLSASYFQGEKRLDYLALIGHIIPPNLKLLIMIVLFIIGYRLDAVLAGVLFSFILTSLISVYLLRKKFGLDIFSFLKNTNTSTAKKVLRYSSVLMGVQFLSDLTYRIDIYMVGYFLTAAQVGIYGVTIEIALLSGVVFYSFAHIFSPIISGAWQRKEMEKISILYKFMSKVVFMLVLPIFFFVCLYPENILSVFGQDFQVGKAALIILAAGQLFYCTVGGAGFILTMTGKQKFQLFNMSLGLVLNTSLNYLLIDKYGINGAAIATTVSIVIINLICMMQIKLFYGFTFFKKSFIKPVAAGSMVYLAFKFIIPYFSSSVVLFLLGAFFILIYFTALYLLGFEKEEADILMLYVRKLMIKRRAH